MQRLIFEQSPYFIFLCLATGIGYAYLLYKQHYAWSKRTNQLLFALRTIVVSILAFLLLGPVIKLISNEYEKPTWVFVVDNSNSVNEVIDSISLGRIVSSINETRDVIEKGENQVAIKDLFGNEEVNIHAQLPASDINRAIQNVVNEYEGKNLGGIILVSDGIYNSGLSPLYTPLRIPVYTVGIGDTTERADLALKNVDYNKVAYQGNKFPVKAQVYVQGIEDAAISVTISSSGKELATREINSRGKALVDFDFLLEASVKGIQRYDVVIKALSQETNVRNNTSSIFIEVVEGKKRVLLIAPAPHPDIKAIRSVVERNSNYEFIVHIPGITNTDAEILKPGAAELVIFHEAIDINGRTLALYNTLSKGPSSVLLLIGAQANIRQLAANGVPLQFEFRGQWDEVTPIINNDFRDFSFSENSNGVFVRYPPAQVPFGKFTFPGKAKILLYQRIGSVVTDRPLLLTWEEDNRKIAALIAEGVWRWRLSEYADNGNPEAFDELFSKLIQYLSTLDEKKKFRCFPLQSEFSDYEPVIIESQVYNELYELVYGNDIQLQLQDESGVITNYSYTTSPGSARYRIGGLKEGVYRFKATTKIGDKIEEASGQFLVKSQSIETQNLTADFKLLRQLADETGGKFYPTSELSTIGAEISAIETPQLIHSEESFNQLINLKWVFFLLLLLISAEWFIRKYMGSY